MNRLLTYTSAILVATAGFYAGRRAGAMKSTKAITSTLPPVEVVASTPTPAPRTVKPKDNLALSEAYEALLSPPSYETYPIFFGAVQKLDLEQIRELHRRVVAIPNNATLIEVVAARWVQLDPDYAADFVRNFPNGTGVKDRTGLVTAWARRDPDSAIAEAIKQGTSSKSTLLLKGAFDTLATKDPEDAVSKLKLIADAKQRTAILDTCLTTWARRDPIAATRWVQSHADSYGVGTDGNDVIAKFAREIAVRDLATALEFTRNLAEPLRQQAQLTVATEWAAGDAAAALAWCRENRLSVTEIPTSTIGSVINAAMHRGPEKTLAWIQSLPEGEERGQIAGYALRFAKAALAPNLFALIPENDQPEYVGPFMKSLNNKKVGAALEWASSLPEGNLRVEAMATLISNYRFKDPVGTIDEFAAGPSRDAAYAAHIRKALQNAPTAAVEQLSKIAAPDFRQEIAVTAFREWRKTDAAAAQKWLGETPHVSAEWKERLNRSRQQ